MKLTIERAALLKALGHVQSVVERRNTIPILSNVLLVAEGDGLSLTATDMDLTIEEKVPAEVGVAGGTTASAHMLYDIVRKLPDGAQVGIAVDNAAGRLTLSAGRSNFQLSTLQREDFPALSDGDYPVRFALQAKELRHLIDRTRFAISVEETRYYLNGVYLHAGENGEIPVLRAVATDGHRLARFEMPLPEGAGEMPGIIVPRKAVGEIAKLIEDSEATVEIAVSDTRIRLAFANTVLSSKLIDGTFPDYQRVIPKGNDKTLEVDCKLFADAVDRVATISTEKSRAVKLDIEGTTLTLSAQSPEAGNASEELEVGYDGTPMQIGFNARYLLDIAQQIGASKAVLSLADSASPTLARDASDTSALYVLMPMRV